MTEDDNIMVGDFVKFNKRGLKSVKQCMGEAAVADYENERGVVFRKDHRCYVFLLRHPKTVTILGEECLTILEAAQERVKFGEGYLVCHKKYGFGKITSLNKELPDFICVKFLNKDKKKYEADKLQTGEDGYWVPHKEILWSKALKKKEGSRA